MSLGKQYQGKLVSQCLWENSIRENSFVICHGHEQNLGYAGLGMEWESRVKMRDRI